MRSEEQMARIFICTDLVLTLVSSFSARMFILNDNTCYNRVFFTQSRVETKQLSGDEFRGSDRGPRNRTRTEEANETDDLVRILRRNLSRDSGRILLMEDNSDTSARLQRYLCEASLIVYTAEEA